MTPQEIFDTVVNHLRQQKAKALKSEGTLTCLYRAADGKKCAVGCLIRDEEYSPHMETIGSVSNLLYHVFCPLSLRDRLQPHMELLIELQGIHDNEPVERWEQELCKLARDFKLTYTPPTMVKS